MRIGGLEGAVNADGEAAVLAAMQAARPLACRIDGTSLVFVLEHAGRSGPWQVAPEVARAALERGSVLVVETGAGPNPSYRETQVPAAGGRPRP